MLLSITNRTPDATDLGYLLHKNPQNVHEVKLGYGKATVFYTKAEEKECTAVLHVDVDPVGLIRSTAGRQAKWALGNYVNDRPYAASSFLSVAISKAFGTALNGGCNKHPELPEQKLDLEIHLPVVPSPDDMLEKLFEPLGYEVEATKLPLEPDYPDWGESRYHSLTLKIEERLFVVLRHLFVLIPALDRDKHYWVGKDEIEKLLHKGENWLQDHPEQEWIVRRYLKFQRRLANEALNRLAPEKEEDEESEDGEASDGAESAETANSAEAKEKEERKQSLHDVRLDLVTEHIAQLKPKSVVDLGCGEGKLLARLVKNTEVPRILGMDVSSRALEIAHARMDRLPPTKQTRLELILGSLIYRDSRLAGFDAGALVEVIEHLDPNRLEAPEQVVFGHASPRTVFVTTPNIEYNVLFEGMKPGALRHGDHRFEWTRAEFQEWAERVAADNGYSVTYEAVGEEHEEHGAPSQMATFTRLD